MGPRKALVVVCSVLALILAVVCITVVTERHPPSGKDKKSGGGAGGALGSAAGSLAGGGMMDQVMESYMSRGGQGGRTLPGQVPGAQDTGRHPLSADGGPGQAEAQPGAEAGSQDDQEAAKELLRLIHMKDSEKGKRQMFGSGTSPSSLPAGMSSARTSASAGGAKSEDEAQVLSKFQAFVDKLQQRAAHSRESDPAAAARAEADAQANGGRVQIMAVDGFKGDKPPTLQLLESVNKDAADSVMMSDDPQLEDGSKDKHGKKFDGNQKTFSTIPIDEVQGAFGGREIHMSQPESVNTGGAPADLKQ